MMNNKYSSIYEYFVDEIENKNLKPGFKLPSEHKLMEQFDTSRETVRKALSLLAQNGYIQKIRGKGSVVLELNKYNFPISGLVSFKELSSKMGRKWVTEVHALDIIQSNNVLQTNLQCKENEKVWGVIRTRSVDGEKIILDKDFFLQTHVEQLTKEICETSIYEYLEEDLQLQISFAKKEVTIEEVTEEDKRLLDLNGHTHIVVVKNFVYLDDATLFQYTESRHRLDKFKFVDFARRVK
ncbi:MULTISPECIES: trehalose operon repressor [Bacillus]|uniref:trehalose operon repressor n=1 Tax=Bacillus TaxID=1386 RepID=UPI001596E561|nr:MULTISPECIES: trehalose operon repressor [Bacillus]